jgi:5-aminolevulinate synthase
MSNLQLLARRCPLMGKAMTVQSGRHPAGKVGAAAAMAAVRGYHAKSNGNSQMGMAKKGFHSGGAKEARALDVGKKETAGKYIEQCCSTSRSGISQ